MRAQNLKAVIIEDNSIVRRVLNISLNRYAQKTGSKIEVYSSDHIARGLNLIFALDPELIIIDSTLPPHAKRDVLEFIKSSETLSTRKVILLHEGWIEEIATEGLPKNYISLSKRDPFLVRNLIREINFILKFHKDEEELKFRLLTNLIQKANNIDLNENNEKPSFSHKLYKVVITLYANLITSVLSLRLKNIKDHNDYQHKKDKNTIYRYWRGGLYFASIFIFVFGLQIMLLMNGGMRFFDIRVSSVFDTFTDREDIDLAESDFDANLIEVIDGKVSLKNQTTPAQEHVTPESFTEGNLIVEPVQEIFEGYPIEPQMITFEKGVTYSALNGIIEESSLRDEITSFEYDPEAPSDMQSIDYGITYQLSPNGSDWYYFGSEGKWIKTDLTWPGSNTIQTVNHNIVSYEEEFGSQTKQLFIRAFLKSDGVRDIELRKLSIKRNLDIVTNINPEPDTPVTTGFEFPESFVVESYPESFVEVEYPETIIPEELDEDLDEPEEVIEEADYPIHEAEIFVHNASYANGNKILMGVIEAPTQAIPSNVLSKLSVQIIYTNEGDITEEITTVTDVIGEVEVKEYIENGFYTYYWELITPSTPGGFVAAILKYDGVPIKTSKPVENSTFTVNISGSPIDTNQGDGICDTSVSPGSQCSFYAAILESNALAGDDNIYFNIPTTDSSYRDYDTLLTANSGDGVGGDDFWYVDVSANMSSITSNINFDASTQTINQGDTNNAGPEIMLVCTVTCGGKRPFFTFAGAGNVTVNGFSIYNFAQGFDISAGNITITNNYIGVDARGIQFYTAIHQDGITFNHLSSGLTVGTPGNGNIFGGFQDDLISISCDNSLLPLINIADNNFGISPDGSTIYQPSSVSTSNSGISIGGLCGDIMIGGPDSSYRNYFGPILTNIRISSSYSAPPTTNLEIYNNFFGTDYSGVGNRRRSSGSPGVYDVFIEYLDSDYTVRIGGPSKGNLSRYTGIYFVALDRVSTPVYIENNSVQAQKPFSYNYSIATVNNIFDTTQINIRNNFLAESSSTPDPYFGLTFGTHYLTPNNSAAISLGGADLVLQGNYLEGFVDAGGIYVYSLSPYEGSGDPWANPTIGGTGALVGSLCNGLEQNCFVDVGTSGDELSAAISFWESKATNDSTIYLDNDFGAGQGYLSNQNVLSQWGGSFELFSGTRRRTDLSAGAISLDFSNNDVWDGWNWMALNSAPNTISDCTDPLDCPLSNGADGQTEIISSDEFAMVRDESLYITDYIIDASGNKIDKSLFDIDEPHLTTLEPFSFDGLPTHTPTVDNGEPWSSDTAATGIGQDWNHYQVMELQVVDANPIWDGSKWVITVDSTTDEDNVSTTGVDDGDGAYSGGGAQGPGGYADGKTSLREAIIVANNFGPAVTIEFNIPTTDAGYVDFDMPDTPNSGDASDGDDYWRIKPTTLNLPLITDSLAIMGSSQSSNVGDTNTFGPEIQLDGINNTDPGNTGHIGLNFRFINTTGNVVDGLNIVNYRESIRVESRDFTLTNTYLNTNPKGLYLIPDEAQTQGVWAYSTVSQQIDTINFGLTNQGNIVTSTGGFGLYLEAYAPSSTVQVNVMGNKFGLSPDGTTQIVEDAQRSVFLRGNIDATVGEAGIGNRNYFVPSQDNSIDIYVSDTQVGSTLDIYNNFFNTDQSGTAYYYGYTNISSNGSVVTTVGAPGKGNLLQMSTGGLLDMESDNYIIQNNTIFAAWGIDVYNSALGENGTIINNYFGSETTYADPYFGVTKSADPLDELSGIGYEASAIIINNSATIQGNYFDGYSNAIYSDDAEVLLTLGGQDPLATSLCGGLEKNCFRNTGNTSIINNSQPASVLLWSNYPVNHATFEFDNDIIYDISATEAPLLITSTDSTFELFSGLQRRTDIAEGTIDISLLASDYVTDVWNYPYTFVSSITNVEFDCTNALDCPGTNGEAGKTMLFAPADVIGSSSIDYPGVLFPMLVIESDGSRISGSPRLGDLEDRHFTMLETFSFDGFTTNTPTIDNGEPWSINTSATNNTSSLVAGSYYYSPAQDLTFNQVAELQYVDANPIWNGSEWVITIESYESIDNVSLAGIDDGDGVYSGGGVNGPNGLPNGVTSFIEAQYVVSQFPNPVTFEYDGVPPPTTDADPVFDGSEWVITVNTTSDEDNVSITGFDDGNGVYSGGGLEGIDGLADGKTSLREAIIVANNFANPVTIEFNIPTTDPGYIDYDDENTPSSGDDLDGDDYWRITQPSGFYGVISNTIKIDGSSQTTNQGDKNIYGPEIQLDGIVTGGTAYGFWFLNANSGTNIVNGLNIRNFQVAILVQVPNVEITNNYINVDAKGLGNNDGTPAYGVRVINGGGSTVSNVVIGKPTAGNVITSASFSQAISAIGDTVEPYYDLTIQSNKIGLTADGTAKIDITNGIALQGNVNALIGGDTAAERNYIAGYAQEGILAQVDHGSVLEIYNNYFNTDITGNLDLNNVTTFKTTIYVAISPNTAPTAGSINIGAVGKGNLIRAEGADGYRGIYTIGNYSTDVNIDSNTIFGKRPIIDRNEDSEINILRNYLAYKDSDPDPYFGKSPFNNSNTSKYEAIASLVDNTLTIQGNHIEGFNNGVVVDYGYGLAQIGGQDVLANSLCQGLEKNCFINNTYEATADYIPANILFAEAIPANEATIYADNSFNYDIGVTPYPAYINQFDASLELMSGTRRRTDLADSFFAFPLTQQDAVFDSWNYTNYATSLVNTKVDCLDPLSCPAGTGEDGKTVLFTVPDALGSIDASYTGIYLTGVVVNADGSSYVPFYNDYETDHLTMQKVSFDGRLTDVQPQDNGEEGTISPGASGNPLTFVPPPWDLNELWQDLRRQEMAEIHYVDANPRWDGDSWYITVEAYDNIDHVSLEGFNDGDGVYSGGGTYGPDGLPDGITTLVEAQYVESQFPFPVDLIFTNAPETDADPQFVSGEWVITVDSTTDEDNVSIDNFDDGDGAYSGGGIEGTDGLADGKTSLREAIIVANNFGEAGDLNIRIDFDIPTTDTGYRDYDNENVASSGDGSDGDDYWRIRPTADLPQIKSNIRINGATQTTNVGNTNTFGPEIQLDGDLLTSPLEIGINLYGTNGDADQNIINSLNIRNFKKAIRVETLNTTITNCYINTDAKGLDNNNGQGAGGIFVENINNDVQSVVIGTPGNGNVISSETVIGFGFGEAIYIQGELTEPNFINATIQSNKMGLNATGTGSINIVRGINLQKKVNALIGGDTSAERNYIATYENIGILAQVDHGSVLEIYNNFFKTDITGNLDFSYVSTFQTAIYVAIYPNNAPTAGSIDIGAVGKGNFIRAEGPNGHRGLFLTGVYSSEINIDSNTIFSKRPIIDRNEDSNINILRNHLAYKDSDPDPYFGKNPFNLTDTSNYYGITSLVDNDLTIQGNHIEGFNNGVVVDYAYGLAQVGGQNPLANSLCGGLEKNCFVNNTYEATGEYIPANILFAQGIPANYTTIYADNTFSYDIGVTPYPAYINQFDATLELMSGTRRRTDLADSFFALPLTQQDAVFDSWNYTNYATSIVNTKVDCLDPLSCPASSGEDGKTVLFTVPDGLGSIDVEYTGVYLSGTVINADGSSYAPFYNDYETDHLTMQKTSFDGRLTDVQPQDNGEEGSITLAASGNPLTLVPTPWDPLELWQDLRWQEIAELHYVDANPRWDGDSWYITIDAYDNIDHVSLEGFDDGDGTYSGGGTYGPDGLPDGVTTLIEAQYVATQFPFPVEFIYSVLPDTDANPQFISGEWVIEVTSTSDEDNVSTTGFDEGDGAYSGGGMDGVDGDADGNTSLREAIIVSNNFSQPVKITFNIPTTDPGYRDYDNPNSVSSGDLASGDDYWRITPTTNLPSITDTTQIMGSTQTTNQSNSNTFGPEIQLDGINNPSLTSYGIFFEGDTGGTNILDGLNILNFYIAISIQSEYATITNNYVNTDSKGLDNTDDSDAYGIEVRNQFFDVYNVVIGTPGNGNTISSKGFFNPIMIIGSDTNAYKIDATIQSNKIGLTPDGTTAIDIGTGIYIAHKVDALIGGNTSAERNYIAGYSFNGILIQPLEDVSIEIYNNYLGTDITGNLDMSHSINPSGATAINWAHANDDLIAGTTIIGAPGKGNLIRNEQGTIGIYVGTVRNDSVTVDSNTIFSKQGIHRSYSNPGPEIAINVLRNYIAYNDTNPDAYFGKTPNGVSGTSADTGIFVSSGAVIQGNYIEGFNNGILFDYVYGLVEIGGQDPMANSLCSGSERNCFRNITLEPSAEYVSASILAAMGLPTNYSTIYADNSFSYDIGVPEYPAYIAQFDASLELMSGTRRRTDIADSFFSFPLTQADAVFDSWNYTNYATTLVNTKVDCLDPLSCPASSGEDGKTVLFTVPDAVGSINAEYTGVYLSGVVIDPDGTVNTPFYNDFETDHLTMQKTSFDGLLTDIQSQDNGEEGSLTPSASGNASLLVPQYWNPLILEWQDLRWYEIAEIHYVDANPRWDGDSWYITVESYDNVDQVSLEGFDDGDGNYSGGGTYGPDGLPNGITTLIEAQYVASQFPQPVEFIYSIIPTTDANPQFISGEWVIEVDSLTNEDNVSVLGYNDGSGVYTGGGITGADGQADGNTSLREAVIVAKKLNQNVRIITNLPGAFTPANIITLSSDNNSTITQIHGFNFDGTAQPVGSACVEITNAYNIEFIDSTFANCKEDGLRISAGTGNRITNTSFTSSVGGIAINLVGGTEDSNGQTANDAGDTDGGANELLNTPEITNITYMGSSTYRIAGRIDGSVSEAPFDITICNSATLGSGYGTCLEELATFTTGTTPVVSGTSNYFNWLYDLTIDGNDGTEQEEFSIFAISSVNSVSEIGTNFDTDSSPSYINPEYEVSLNTPADNATLQTLTPTLTWNSNATTFHEFELYLDDELIATIAGNARQYTFPTNEALTEGDYTWYVVLKETISGTDIDLEITEERDFTIDMPTPPPPPPPPVIYTITTTGPKDVNIFELESIIFQWTAKASNNSTPKFDQFTLRIFNADNQLYDELVLAGTSNLYEYSFGLLQGDYKWEVVGVVTTTKNSVTSDRASFKVVRDAEVSEPTPDNNGEQPGGGSTDDGNGFGGVALGFLKNIGDTLGLGTERTSEIGLGVIASVAVAGPLAVGLSPIRLLAVLFSSVFRKKKKYWGIVFDSETSEVVPLSIIRLYKDNNYITQSISDFDGKFGFLINESGDYMLEARSEGYETHNSGVKVSSDLEVAKDVELIKLGSEGPGFWSKLKANRKTAIKYLNRILLTISLLGLVNTIIAVNRVPSTTNIIILIIYVVLLGINFLIIIRSTLIRNRGKIIDASTGTGLGSTSIRLYNDIQQVAILLTNKDGFLKTNIQPGVYKAIINKPGYTYSDSADGKSIQITVNEKGYIEQEIKLKKI